MEKNSTEKIFLEKRRHTKHPPKLVSNVGPIKHSDVHFIWFVVHEKYYTDRNYCCITENIIAYTSKNCARTNNKQLWLRISAIACSEKLFFSTLIFLIVTVLSGHKFPLSSDYLLAHKITGGRGGGEAGYGTGKDCWQFSWIFFFKSCIGIRTVNLTASCHWDSILP